MLCSFLPVYNPGETIKPVDFFGYLHSGIFPNVEAATEIDAITALNFPPGSKIVHVLGFSICCNSASAAKVSAQVVERCMAEGTTARLLVFTYKYLEGLQIERFD